MEKNEEYYESLDKRRNSSEALIGTRPAGMNGEANGLTQERVARVEDQRLGARSGRVRVIRTGMHRGMM